MSVAVSISSNSFACNLSKIQFGPRISAQIDRDSSTRNSSSQTKAPTLGFVLGRYWRNSLNFMAIVLEGLSQRPRQNDFPVVRLQPDLPEQNLRGSEKVGRCHGAPSSCFERAIC